MLQTSTTSASALAITLGREPPALRSTRNHPRTAVRRGAAWPPAERPSSCLVVQEAVSRWQVALPPGRHACRAPRVPPTATRFAVPAASWVPGCPDADRAVVALSASSVRVRVSGVRPVRCPVSARLVSDARCPCPVSSATVRHPFVSHRCPLVRTSEFVERAGAAGSHPARDWPGRRATHRVRDRLIGCPSPAWRLELAQAALAAAASAWTRQSSWQARERWPDSTTWPTGSSRLRARIAVG
jgi:hypothetical protein